MDSNMIKNNFSKNLAREMERVGISATALGNRCGVACSTIGRYISGASTPNVETLCKLATALGCKVSDLLAD